MKKRLVSLFLAIAMMIVVVLPASANTYSANFMISSTFAQMKRGEVMQLTVYSGAQEATQVTWSSSNPAAIRVDGYGTVTAVTLGQAVITATSAATGATATCKINVGIPGIDVSQHRGTIDWKAVKSSGVEFAILRTGYGNSDWVKQKDTYFETNYAGAVANGVKVGAYHYSYATTPAMAADEAAMVLSILNGRKLDYPVVFDVEDKVHYPISAQAMGEIVNAFASRIQQAGYKVAVYSFVNFYNARLTSPTCTQYDTWIAHWGVSQPNFNRPYTMWQYAAEKVPGVPGLCDVNYSYFDYAGTASQPAQPPSDPSVFTSSAEAAYTFGDTKDYFYKITTADTSVPTVTSSNPAVAEVQFSQQMTDGYVFRVTHKGAGQTTITTTSSVTGASTSFNVTGNALPTIQYFTDVGSTFSLQKGQTYSLRVMPTTLATGVKFTIADTSVMSGGTATATEGGWFYPITGLNSGTTSIYAQVGDRAPVLVATVTVA